ncbi:MAG: acyl-CoA dehydrogenase family protein [Solirubrobacteraceae bacterium]
MAPATPTVAQAPSAAALTTRADADPLVARAKAFALEVLKPAALQTDRTGVTKATIGQLRQLGLLNHRAPAEYGGVGLDAVSDRRIHEHIAYACLNTWLIWAQHAGALGRFIGAPEAGERPGELAAAILRGEILAGAGVSDVRRFPDRYIAARREPGGWRLRGAISWVSGWGLNSVMVVAAVEPSTRTVVLALLRVDGQTRALPLDLRAVSGSRTQRVILADARVEDENVLDVLALERWQERDRAQASDAGPHSFAMAAAVLDELRLEQHPLAQAVVATWDARVAQLREDAYGLAELAARTTPLAHVDERVAIKAAVGEALAALTQSLVIARSGRAIVGEDTAQLHARNALFVLVQGQTTYVKDAQLSRLAATNGRRGGV